MSTVDNTLMIAFADGLGEAITPTANFTPAAGSALANLRNNQLASRCVTPDLSTDMQLTWDFGAPVAGNVFMLTGSNATDSVTRRWRAADDSGFTSNVIQSGAGLTSGYDATLGVLSNYVPPWGKTLIYVHPTSFSKRYYRWHQSDGSNPDGAQEWGVARVGLGWQPLYGLEYTKAIPLIMGAPGSEILIRRLEIVAPNLTEEEAYSLQSLTSVALSTRRILAIPEPLSPAKWRHDALWCTFEGAFVREAIARMSYTDKRYRLTLTFREVTR